MFEDRHRTGRPKIYTDRDARNLTKLVKKNRKASSSLLDTKWELSSGAKACARTVRRVALSKGYSWKAAAKKPRLTKQAQKDRLKWCQQQKKDVTVNKKLWAIGLGYRIALT